MTYAKVDDDLDVKRRRRMTSQHLHICFLYVMLTLCLVTLVACLVFVYDVSRRQWALEQTIGGEEKEEGGCCRCCLGGKGAERSGEEGPPTTPSSPGNESRLGDASGTAQQQQHLEEVGDYPRSRGQGRNRRDLQDPSSSNRTLNFEPASSGGETTKIEASDDLSGSRSFVPTSATGVQWDGSDSEDGDSSSSSSSSSSSAYSSHNNITRSSGLRSPRQATEEPTSNNRRGGRTTKKTTKNRKQNNARTETTKNSKKNERNSEHHLAAIHLHAPEHFDRKYESGPVVSLNGSDTRDTVYRFWQKANWVDESIYDVFHLDDVTGHVTVEIEGIYMIYAQVVYHDLSGRWSFGIYVGDQERVKCLATEQLKDLHSYHPTSHGVYHSCYTALVLHIRKNQSVSLRCLYGSRTILTRPEFTFWGIVRLS